MTTLRLRRSELSTPGSSPKMLAKAAASRADLVFCDLEDSVAPAQKGEARAHVVEALRAHDWGGKTRAVRVNGVRTPWCLDDLLEVVRGAGEHLDVVIIPKITSPRDVWFVETVLDQVEGGRRERPVAIEVLIEEVEALVNVNEIARCSPRLEALIFGPGDFSASQGVRVRGVGVTGDRYPGDLWHYARNRIVVAARAAGIEAVDGPFANFRDPEGYRREATWSSTLGFVGKWAIHPSQIDLANEVYAPTAEEVESARAVVAAYDDAERQGLGAAAYEGAMIDAATVRILRNTLERAELIGR